MEENVNAIVRQPRSLARRLAAPMIVALALVGGGGWGTYYYLSASPTDFDDATIRAHRATDELKALFATDTPSTTPSQTAAAAIVETSPPQSTGDRYSLRASSSTNPFANAPQLPPTESVEEPAPATTAADSIEMESNQTSPQVVGDRYGTQSAPPMVEAPTTAVVESEAETEANAPADEPAIEDVARGQEPEVNPLRAAEQSLTAAGELEPQEIAEKRSAPAPPAQIAPVPGNSLASRQNGASQQEFAGGNSGQYEPSAQPTLAAPPSVALEPSQPSATRRQPAPAYSVPPTASRQPEYATEQATPLAAQSRAPSAAITPTPGLTNQPGSGRPGEQLLEGAQSPSITIQKLAPSEIQVGKRCTFAIRVHNNGQRTAQDVKIHDEIPLGTELVGTAPRANVSGSSVIWDLGTLSVGEERTVEMELIPTDEGELGSVATVTMAAQASAKARCTRPQLALRLTSKPQVTAGQEIMVQVELSNPGTGDATGVMLLQTVPSGVSHEAGRLLEFEVGTLKPGAERSLELILSAEQAGKINNTMTARGDANLEVQAGCEFEVIAPELRVSIDGPNRRYLERPATYEVNIDNPGTASATDVQLVTQLPKGLKFVSANNMGEYDSSTHSIQWSLAELPANERGTVKLVALPIEPGAQVLQVATRAQQGLEDRQEKQVLVEGLAALEFEVTSQESLIEVGENTAYEIRVTNQGSQAASNVQVMAIMPGGMQALSGQGETQHTIHGEQVTFTPMAQLMPKAEATFQIQAQGTRPGDQRVQVLVKADDFDDPITKEVNTRVYADE